MVPELDRAFDLAIDRQILSADDLALDDEGGPDPGTDPPLVHAHSHSRADLIRHRILRRDALRVDARPAIAALGPNPLFARVLPAPRTAPHRYSRRRPRTSQAAGTPGRAAAKRWTDKRDCIRRKTKLDRSGYLA